MRGDNGNGGKDINAICRVDRKLVFGTGRCAEIGMVGSLVTGFSGSSIPLRRLVGSGNSDRASDLGPIIASMVETYRGYLNERHCITRRLGAGFGTVGRRSDHILNLDVLSTVVSLSNTRPSFSASHIFAAVSGNLAWYLLHASRPRRMKWRLDIHIEGGWETLLLARPLQTAVSCTQATFRTPRVLMKSRSISTGCYPRDMSTTAKCPPTAVSSERTTSSSCRPTIFRSFLSAAPHYRDEEPSALMGQIEAYLAEDPKREPWVIHDIVLYGDLVRSPDALWMFLVTRKELTTLTHTLCIPAWSSAQIWDYLVSHVFARMDNLRSLSLPSFDLHILRHIQLSVSGHAEAELPRQGQ
ncbi:hypothetical protein ARMGADRAFT_1038180 [Armillaria gallica]|uniref:Uncharacterized protein n=1 Tax=Armillaria gallica TaxID=47427 RepID=A0A2H3CX26_ARMGA|nr:hypothetical protein ARMGADRAFT_1038180 [Armillaria gallica]